MNNLDSDCQKADFDSDGDCGAQDAAFVTSPRVMPVQLVLGRSVLRVARKYSAEAPRGMTFGGIHTA